MTDLFESDLAAMLHTTTPEPLHEVSAAEIRARGARRRTQRMAVVAGVLVAVVAAAVLAVTRHGSSTDRALSTANWPRVTIRGVSIAFPPDWQVHGMYETFSFSNPVMYLGNQQMHSPCQHDGNSTSCTDGVPRARLAPGGVVIVWWAMGSMPNHSYAHLLDSSPGQRSVVGGYPAKIATREPDHGCRADGGTTLVTAMILKSRTDFWSMTACIDSTGTTERDEVLASLRSAHFTY